MIPENRHFSDAVFGLGSNCGDRRGNILKAAGLLTEKIGKGNISNIDISDIYQTPDTQGGLRPYMNAVIKISSSLDTSDLESIAKDIELSLGRNQEARNRGDVPVDIDLVIFESKILRPRDFNASFFRIGYQKVLSNL